MSVDESFMREALLEARKAETLGEVPVGAVLVFESAIIARSHNQPISAHDPSAHAEILALREGGRVLQNYRLLGTTLYVSLEPCLMCFTAMVHARIARLVFAATDPKTGVCGSRFNASTLDFFNHRFDITGGVLAEESTFLLKTFFKVRR